MHSVIGDQLPVIGKDGWVLVCVYLSLGVPRGSAPAVIERCRSSVVIADHCYLITDHTA
jgi:hypothetical protein